MSTQTAIVRVEGFEVGGVGFEDDELIDAAHEIASDIGMRLSSLGRECGHGTVRVELDGREASSED